MTWLTDWDEAARHPQRTRAVLFIGFFAITVGLADWSRSKLALDSGTFLGGVAVGIGAVALAEPVMRRHRRVVGTTQPGSARLARMTVTLTLFGAGVVVGALVNSLVGTILIILGAVAVAATKA
jgi:hypothetical protein